MESEGESVEREDEADELRILLEEIEKEQVPDRLLELARQLQEALRQRAPGVRKPVRVAQSIIE
jgi:hypothetical protein